MSAQDFGFWAGLVLTAICALYAALAYHRPKAAAMDKSQQVSMARLPWPRSIPIICALLAWIAVGFDYYDRHYNVPLLDPIITVGVAPPHTYFLDINSDPLLSYKEDYKLMLITRVIYADRDRMTDKAIDKGGEYTITGGQMRIVSTGSGGLKFMPFQVNALEINLVLLPSKISPDSITNLGDVERLGGKILGVRSQTTVAGGPDIWPSPPGAK